MLKGMEDSATEGFLGLRRFYNPMNVFRRPVLSTDFLEQPAPTASLVLYSFTLVAKDIIILDDVVPLGRLLSIKNRNFVPQDDGYTKQGGYIEKKIGSQKQHRLFVIILNCEPNSGVHLVH
jgi:hypothetical protein